MKVPLLDLNTQFGPIMPAAKEAVDQVLASKYLIVGVVIEFI